jgi:outer membrane protein assembly factor BamB
VLAVGVVATLAVGLSRDDSVPGRPTGGTGSTRPDERPHELELVTEIEVFAYPKDEGRPSDPDELAMEIHGDTGYIATLTGRALHLKAIRLTDGEFRWEQDFPLEEPISSFTMGVSGDVLLARVSNGSYVDLIGAYDLATGEYRWDVVAKLSHVVANRMITYDPDADTINVHDLETGDPVWSTAGDGGRASEFPQQTAESLAQPRDPGDEHHATFEVAGNTDENQYVVQASMHSGALTVYDLATGKVISQGTAGDRMTQVVAYEDTVYAYRQTPAELKAYAVTDLSTPKWSVQTPASKDGAILDICGDQRLCLKTVSGTGGPILAVDTETGETVWQTDEYVSALPPTMAGDRMVLSHQDGTVILDPDTGEALETFDSDVYALPGDGAVVGSDGGELKLSQADGTTVSLGKASGTGLTEGTCEWTRTVVLCADEESYQLWRYRG